MSNNQKRLSLCIVAKTDELKLSDLVKLKKEIVDEIILVNIGTTENKTQLFKEHGINVLKISFTDDISSAKNVALDKASGKWILMLEANELLELNEAKKISPLLDNPMVEGYLFNINTKIQSNYEINTVQSLRLFRNRSEYRYKYKVYEKIPDDVMTSVQDANITINYNSKYLEYERLKAQKTTLLKAELNDNPEDGYLNYVYGIELLNGKKYQESIIQFEEARKKIDYYHVFNSHLYKLLTSTYIKIHQYKKALKTVNEGINLFANDLELFYQRGIINMTTNNIHKAIEDYNICLNIVELFEHDKNKIESKKIYLALGEAYEEILDFQKALESYKIAYENQINDEAIYRIGHIICKNPLLGNIDTELLKYLDNNRIEDVFTLIDILCIEKKYEKALAYTEKIEINPNTVNDIAFIKGICHMMLGKVENAECFYSSIPNSHAYYLLVIQKRIQNFWINNKMNDATLLLKELENSQTIKQNIKTLYLNIHNVLAGDEIEFISMNDEEYEVLAKILEQMLWVNNNDKANILLEWVLKSDNEKLWSNIILIYTQQENISQIEKILSHYKHKEIRIKFIGEVTKILYENKKIKAAFDLLQKGPFESLDYRGTWIWNQIKQQRINKLIDFGLNHLELDEEYKNKALNIKGEYNLWE